jgi:hypothetical protein
LFKMIQAIERIIVEIILNLNLWTKINVFLSLVKIPTLINEHRKNNRSKILRNAGENIPYWDPVEHHNLIIFWALFLKFGLSYN